MIVIYVLAVNSVTRGKFKSGTYRLLWLVIVLFAPFFGTIVYFR